MSRQPTGRGPDATPRPPCPPAMQRALLSAFLPPVDRRTMLAEVDALYAARRARHGRLRAALWYIAVIAGFARRLAGERTADGGRGFLADQAVTAQMLLRRKSFAVAMVVTLALGLAGVAAVYAIAHWVLLRPVPGIDNQERLVALRMGSTQSDRPSWPISHIDLEALREGIHGLQSLDASHRLEVNLVGGGDMPPARVAAAAVTGGWFRTLGVELLAGREPTATGRPETSGVGEVVVDTALAAALASDPVAALGAPITVNGQALTVVGVTAPDFHGAGFPGDQRLWMGAGSLPTIERSVPQDVFENGYAGVWDEMVGRLGDGAGAASVAAEANGIVDAIRDAGERPHSFMATHFVIQVTSRLGLDYGLQGPVSRTLTLLAAAGAFLLLLAVTNAANLGLAHAVTRRAVYAVQSALGIGRGRLVRQVLAEYVVLGVVAGCAAAAIVALGARLFRRIQLDEFGGSLSGFVVEPRVILGVGAVAVFAALLAGAGPCVLAARQGPAGQLKGGGDGTRGARRLRDVLIVVQVAVSTTLLVGAGLMGRTIAALQGTDLGFDPDGMVAFTIDPESQGYDGDRIVSLLADIERELEATPGTSVGFVFPQPLRSNYLTSWLSPSDDPDERGVVAAHMQVAGSFLDTLGARVIAGEPDLEAWSGRSASQPLSVVLTRTAAAALAPEQPPQSLPGRTFWKRTRDAFAPVVVAAVIEDLSINGPAAEPPAIYVWPWAQTSFDGPATGWVRMTAASTAAAMTRVQSSLRTIDPLVPAFDTETVAHRVATISATQRVVAGLATGVSVLGLVLAAIGLYSVLGYAVAERRREIGIRCALGAAPGALRRRVLAGGLARVAMGLVPGIAGALMASRWLESLLFGVTTLDAPSYVGSMAMLLIVAPAASWLPARWASSIAPSEVLRGDD